jgi:hypothetical protein
MRITANNYWVRLPPINKFCTFGNKIKRCLKKKIKKLPEVLKRYIFDFLKLELWLNEFQNTLNSRHCITLNYTYLRPLIPRALAIPAFTHLCIQKIKFFKSTWDFFKTKKGRNFKLMKNGNDFALSLLMCYYH